MKFHQGLFIALPLVIAASLLVDLVLCTLSGWPNETFVSNSIRCYAVFLFLYCIVIMSVEYIYFHILHKNKSIPLDYLLVILAFVSINRMGFYSGSFVYGGLALISFLAILISWELYTVVMGNRCYFNAASELFRFAIVIWYLTNSLLFRIEKRSITHLDEYVYWIAVDSLCLFLVLLGFSLLPTLGEPVWLELGQITVVCTGVYVGVFNVWRYSYVFNNARCVEPRINDNG